MTNDLQSALPADAKIGFLTWYDCRDAHVTPSRLEILFDRHGLSKDHLPDNIKPKNAFQKATRKAVSEISKTSDNRRSVVRLISDGTEKVLYGVVDLNVQEKQESIDPDFSDRVWLNKIDLKVYHDRGHDLSIKVEDIYNRLCGEYTTRDISRMIVKTMDKICCVPLRDAGVIYFVPIGFEKELTALQNVVNSIGECNMRVFSLGSNDGNANGIVGAAKSQIQDKISSLKDEINNLRQSMKDGVIKGATIDNGIEVRRQKFNDLKSRCRVLADALRIKADALEGDLNEVDVLIKDELEVFLHGDVEAVACV